MAFIKKADGVIFIEEELEKTFNSLPEKDWLKKAIQRAINDLKENIFCGEIIPKRLIPKEYIRKYRIDNLSWYPLPNDWRLVYSIAKNEIEIIAVIIEYFDHKNYERRFKY